MAATTWKISTFVAMAAAGFLALHPLGNTTAEKDPEGAAKANHHASGGLWGYLMGATSSPDHSPAAHTGTHLQALRDARNQAEECEALHALRDEATGDEEAIAEIADRASPTHRRGTRICAVEALENIPTGAARSHLINLMNDGDRTVREWAMRALATKARDDAAAFLGDDGRRSQRRSRRSTCRDHRARRGTRTGGVGAHPGRRAARDGRDAVAAHRCTRADPRPSSPWAMLTKVLDDGWRTFCATPPSKRSGTSAERRPCRPSRTSCKAATARTCTERRALSRRRAIRPRDRPSSTLPAPHMVSSRSPRSTRSRRPTAMPSVP